jgi:hypothetical protein
LTSLLGGAIITVGIYLAVAALRPSSLTGDRIYYTRFGGVYCGHMEYTSCGIRLWDCSDDRVYECLHEVAWKETQ